MLLPIAKKSDHRRGTENMVFEEKTVSSETVYNGHIINVHVDTVAMPDGKTAFRDIVDHPGGVGILAFTDDNKIILVKQFRKPIEKAIYEIPAGKIDRGEEPLKCGIRELEEETGFKAKEFVPLGYMYPSPGFTNEVTYAFMARGLYKGTLNPDEDEYLDIEAFEIDEVKKMIMNNEINDAKTVFAFFKGLELLK